MLNDVGRRPRRWARGAAGALVGVAMLIGLASASTAGATVDPCITADNSTPVDECLIEVTVNKHVVGLAEGDAPQFPFTVTGADEPSFNLGHMGRKTVMVDLATLGSPVITVSETLPAGYEALSSYCRPAFDINPVQEVVNGTGGSATTAEIGYPEPGSRWECYFTNARSPELIVDKVVTGGTGDPTPFSFSLTGAYTLPEMNGAEVTEPPVIDPVAFELADGESRSLPLKGAACPLIGRVDNVSLQSKDFHCLPADYVLTESLPVPEGYEFVDVTCTRTDPVMEMPKAPAASLTPIPGEGTEPTVDGSAVSFGNLYYGTVIRCTYTNLKLPKLTVTKVLTNGRDAGLTTPFPFSLTGQDNFTLTAAQSNGPRILPVGQHTVTENTVPAGFTFTSAVCSKPGTVSGQAFTLDLAAGDDVTCTFTNDQTAPPPAVIAQVLNPRLAIAKTGPRRARGLQRLTYSIRVRNPGKAVARNVVVTDRLPSGLVYVKASRRATVRGRTITIPMGNLQPGRFRTVKVTVRAAANVRGRKVNVAVARATDVRPVRDTAATVFRPLVRRVIPAVTG